MERNFLDGTWQDSRTFSPAVITSGCKIIWLAGHGAIWDDERKSLAGNFEGQTRQSFKLLERTLNHAGGYLADIVSMTVFISDARHGTRFTEIREEYFKGTNYPASALITVSGFAQSDMMLEIQGIAVVE
ncbi:MAG: RidA family protein [Desulfobulbia bacterium]